MPKPKFRVGQFVTYDVTGVDGMAHFHELNGSIGLIVKVIRNAPRLPLPENYSSAPTVQSATRYGVQWMIRIGNVDLKDFEDDTEKGTQLEGYPECLLRAIPQAPVPQLSPSQRKRRLVTR